MPRPGCGCRRDPGARIAAAAPAPAPAATDQAQPAACSSSAATWHLHHRSVIWSDALRLQTDTQYHVVRGITADAVGFNVAGKVPFATVGGYSGDGGLATSALLKSPSAVWVDDGEDGPQVFIADTGAWLAL